MFVEKRRLSSLSVTYHLNYTCEGIILPVLELNPDLTPREWNTPINSVDSAAYQHDLCYAYAKHQDRKARNKLRNDEVFRELDNITKPSLRERLDRGIFRNLINAKVNMGLGLKKIPIVSQ